MTGTVSVPGAPDERMTLSRPYPSMPGICISVMIASKELLRKISTTANGFEQLVTSTWFRFKNSSVSASCNGSSSTSKQKISRPSNPPVSVSSSSSMAGVACNVCTSDSRKGRTIVKSLPFPGTLFSDKVPPISSISLRVMESPRPKPSSFSVPDRRANSPKIFSCSSSGIPTPESETVIVN